MVKGNLQGILYVIIVIIAGLERIAVCYVFVLHYMKAEKLLLNHSCKILLLVYKIFFFHRLLIGKTSFKTSKQWKLKPHFFSFFLYSKNFNIQLQQVTQHSTFHTLQSVLDVVQLLLTYCGSMKCKSGTALIKATCLFKKLFWWWHWHFSICRGLSIFHVYELNCLENLILSLMFWMQPRYIHK